MKIGIKWNGSVADVFVNGSKVVSGTPFTTTNMENLYIQASDVTKNIECVTLYPSPLSDANCIILTT